MVELKRSTLKTYRYLWEAHASPRLGEYGLRDIDARKVLTFRGELLTARVGPQSIFKTMSMLQIERFYGNAPAAADREETSEM